MAINKAVIEQFQNGSREAFNSLYDEMSRFIYNVIFKMVRSQEEAEELTHDVFIKLFDYRSSFNHSVKFETWAYRIAVNHTLNQIKRKKTFREKLNVMMFKPYQDDEFTSVDVGPSLAEKCLLRVKPDFRICLILREIEGKSYEEVASILGISIGTVRSRLNRGKKMFKTQYERMCTDVRQ